MPKWELRAVDPGLVRVPTEPQSPLTPGTVEVVGVVWNGKPMALGEFLDLAGNEGWQIVGVGNTTERRHRLYLQRSRPATRERAKGVTSGTRSRRA